MVKNLVDGIKAKTLSQCLELSTQYFTELSFEIYQTDLDFAALKFVI